MVDDDNDDVRVVPVKLNEKDCGVPGRLGCGVELELAVGVAVDNVAPAVVGGMKYLIVLASGSSSFAPVRDCMYFFSGNLISAICGWRAAEISARSSSNGTVFVGSLEDL